LETTAAKVEATVMDSPDVVGSGVPIHSAVIERMTPKDSVGEEEEHRGDLRDRFDHSRPDEMGQLGPVEEEEEERDRAVREVRSCVPLGPMQEEEECFADAEESGEEGGRERRVGGTWGA
jgi:hypothetical protein